MPSAWQSKTCESQVARGAFAGGWTAWRAGPRPRPRDPPVPTIPTQKDPRCIAAEPGKHHRSPGQADCFVGRFSFLWMEACRGVLLEPFGLNGNSFIVWPWPSGRRNGAAAGEGQDGFLSAGSLLRAGRSLLILTYLSPLKNINKQTRHLTLRERCTHQRGVRAGPAGTGNGRGSPGESLDV